jgi:hypothetical protein
MNATSTAANVSDLDDDYDYDYDLTESLEAYDWTELGPSLAVYSITLIAGVLGRRNSQRIIEAKYIIYSLLLSFYKHT